ncbi:general secretion pathway protein GspB [Massilia sp. PAMC28688]|uniref:general secretion pathway protein GspB n=1 Tax=Massilia sp. PAMC28688 TaxID=2861283 RepID=UPI001C62D28B|nr:general secretion pathway protein GspB [Massilia sp. PAMC28688]QYF94103.1 general secretion pathway protein GspB [Massilia sp. PAMC28688]
MSYILEALKKAQAERQLGNAPSIHTMPIPTASQERSGAAPLPLLLAGGGLLLALAAAALWWRQAAAPVAPAPAAVLAATPAPAPAVIVVPPSPQDAPVAMAPAPPERASAPVTAPVTAPAARVAAPPSPPAPAAAPPAPRAVATATVPQGPRDAASAPDESIPFATQLPEQIQRELPKLAFGGYMYSKNPADRLLLIDNVLRHEGQEVAPGVILEQLQPRAAVLNYRGTRYRVAY